MNTQYLSVKLKFIMSSPLAKVIFDYKDLKKRIRAHKVLGHKIVCTIGSWDMLHIGHLRYLHKAKEYGDILLVGVDSDRGIKSYKGDLRPIIPEKERIEMLTYQSCVDYITVVDDIDTKGNWQYKLIKEVPIDVFITVQNDSYPEDQIKEIKALCKSVTEIPRQAIQTSSTDIIQNILKSHLLELVEQFKSK